MKEFTVTAKDQGQRLNRWLERCVPSLNASLMYKYLRLKRIKINGKRCEASTRLQTGDIISLYINDSFFGESKSEPQFRQASRSLSIVYEDDRLSVLYKPAGVLVHEDNKEYTDTLIHRFLRYLYEKGEYQPDKSSSFTPALCNRLDRGTSGLVLAAKTPEVLRELDWIIKNRLIQKQYLCIAVGNPPKDGVYHAFLSKNEKFNRVHISQSPVDGAKEIYTGIHTLERSGELALLEIDLITGRTHQIRAHLAFLGAPLLGDGKYGNGEINRKYSIQRQALCAYKLTFKLDKRPESILYDLNNRKFEIPKVWFRDQFFSH